MSVHISNMADPEPRFMCGRTPRQQNDQIVASIDRPSRKQYDWLKKRSRTCRSCLRALRAALARAPREERGS